MGAEFYVSKPSSGLDRFVGEPVRSLALLKFFLPGIDYVFDEISCQSISIFQHEHLTELVNTEGDGWHFVFAEQFVKAHGILTAEIEGYLQLILGIAPGEVQQVLIQVFISSEGHCIIPFLYFSCTDNLIAYPPFFILFLDDFFLQCR